MSDLKSKISNRNALQTKDAHESLLKSQISDRDGSQAQNEAESRLKSQISIRISANESNLKSQISNRALACIVLLWLVAIPALIPRDRSQDSSLPIPLQHTIDPNVAPWWELSALPGVGEGLAKRIIEFREAACANGAERAFEFVGDLEQIRGIGPKTAARLAPYLRFEKRCQRTEAGAAAGSPRH